MHYDDIAIEIIGESVRNDAGQRIGRYRVRVLQSPVGEMTPDQAVPVEFIEKELQQHLDRLERRELDREGLIALGRTLAMILLPSAPPDGGPSVIDFLRRSLLKAAPDLGVRLRLRLSKELTVVPWEYLFVEREGGKGMDGFLALDPRVAIVRHEALAVPVSPPLITGDLKVVAATAAPDELPELDLDREMEVLTNAIDGLRGVALERCEHATLPKLQPLLPGAGIFHFAGHGEFTRQMGARPGTYTGTGFFAFEDKLVDAEAIGINLQGNGIRVAVLAGCDTARRDGVNVWSGIAPALVKAGVPAVVANQYAIQDRSAIAFSRGLYQALSGGLPLERAVAAGRIAVFNADPDGRDWGVPVLYLRANDGQLFRGAAESTERERARATVEAAIHVRAKEVQAGGVLQAAEITRMIDGAIIATVAIAGKVFGTVAGATVGRLEGGKLDVRTDVGSVKGGGSVTGVKIDTIGFGVGDEPSRPARSRAARPVSSEAPASAGPLERPSAAARKGVLKGPGGAGAGHEATKRGPRSSASGSAGGRLTSSVTAGKVSDGTVGGTQTNDGRTTGISGSNVQIGGLAIIQGTMPERSAAGTTGRDDDLTEQIVRLDVALPKRVVIDVPFALVVAVMQPSAPVISVADLEQVKSAGGRVSRANEDAVVLYRVEVTGAGFTVAPPSAIVSLRAGESSELISFQVTPLKLGQRSLVVHAYQEVNALAAQSRLSIEVNVAIAPT